MSEKMKSWFWYRPGDIRLEEVDVPAVGPGQALVKVDVGLTCGTDLKMYKRGHAGIKAGERMAFGHEYAGTVVAVGSAVKGVAPGMRVVGYGSGAFAEYKLTEAPPVNKELLPIPDSLPSEAAALTEPLACAFHGTMESNIALADTVVVNGAGPIGLMFVRLCQLRGARVICCDMIPGRLEAARKLGADETVLLTKDVDQVAAVKALTEDGKGVHVGIEAVGLPVVWEKTIQMVRPGGLAMLFGGCPPGATITVDCAQLHYSEITIKGVFNFDHPDHFIRAFQIIQRGELDYKVFISDEARLGDVKEVFDRLASGYEGIKIAIRP